MKQLLRKFAETPGVAGDEEPIRDVIRTSIADQVDHVREDDLGNLICRIEGSGPTLMVAAHMDQIGLSVKRIDDDGFVRFTTVGGVSLQSLMNQRVTIHGEEPVTGVIGMKPPHLMKEEERKTIPELGKLFIDIGAIDKADAEDAGVRLGDYVTFDRGFASLRNDYVTGVAFDNRVGCAVTVEAAKRFDEDYELAIAFTSQEEVGLKGAKTAAYSIDPDVGLAIDTSPAGDVPAVTPDETDLQTGDGVEITMIQSGGRGLITSQLVRQWLIETAETNEHPYQRGVRDGGQTDAANIYLVKEGVPTGSIGVPTRHIHSATEVVNMDDMRATADYVEDVFKSLPEYF